PRPAVAAGPVPIAVVVEVPVIAVAIDVVVGILDVVETAASGNPNHVRHVVEAEVRPAVPVADPQREAPTGPAVAPIIRVAIDVVPITVIGPGPAIPRRYHVDLARNLAIADEGPRPAVAARAVPVAVVVHVPVGAVAIDVVPAAADVVDARNATHRVDVRLVVEAEIRTAVAVADPKRDAERGVGDGPAVAIGAPPVVVGVTIVAPVPAIGRRNGVDGLRHGAVADEGPRAPIAARAVPVAVVVHVPGVVVAIDVLIGALDVVHAGPARDRDDARFVVEAQVGAAVSIPDLKA